jgi:sugar phosphate isomerase/epimerase
MKFPSPALLLATILMQLPTFSSAAESLDKIPRIGGFVVGVQAWTFNKSTLFEAIDKTKAAGGNVMEVYLMGMPISAETGAVVLDEDLSDEHIALVKKKCSDAGVQIVNAYIGSKAWTRIGTDAAQLRKFFEFGSKMGLQGFTGEPAETQWDMLEALLKEFDMIFAVHNHIKGFEAPYIGGEYKYWDPRYTFSRLEKRDPRFGICFDTGHAARSGLDVVEVQKAIAGRCHTVHLKDVVAADPDGHDVPFGTGVVDVRALLTELERQKIRGHVAVEYEWFTPHLEQDVAKCFAYLREWKTAPAKAEQKTPNAQR